MSVTIQVRRDSAANWTSVNPVLNQGEFGEETDTKKLKIGDGSTAWASLPYITASNFSGGVTLPDYLAPAVVPLTFVGAGTTLVNAALGNAFNLTLTASTTTLGNPSNPVDGQVIRFRITQGAGGSFTLAYGTAYDFGAAGSPTLSTTAAKADILGFEYVASISKWCYLGSGLGF